MPRTKSSVRCVGEELWWAIEQTPSEVQEIVEAALADDAEFIKLTLADPEGEPSKWSGRDILLRTRYVTTIAPPLAAIEEHTHEH